MMDARTAWILANPAHSHIVYPYTDDRRLAEAVGFYTSCGIAGDGAVILIATETHRQEIKRYLKGNGDVEALEASGQLVFFDAAELMNRFMVDGNPDPKLFKAEVKTLIQRARHDERTGRNRNVRLFGEMVNLLWPTNNAAAERLEELWDETIAEYLVPLL
jgi:DcmR-like sensory protein